MVAVQAVRKGQKNETVERLWKISQGRAVCYDERMDEMLEMYDEFLALKTKREQEKLEYPDDLTIIKKWLDGERVIEYELIDEIRWNEKTGEIKNLRVKVTDHTGNYTAYGFNGSIFDLRLQSFWWEKLKKWKRKKYRGKVLMVSSVTIRRKVVA